MKKRTEKFKFLFPLTAMKQEESLIHAVHVTDLEVHYTGYQWGELKGTDEEFDADIDKVLILDRDGTPGYDLAPLLDTTPFNDLREEILEATYNNVSFAFEQLDQSIEDYEAEVAMEGKDNL